jgi:hypothetical protein
MVTLTYGLKRPSTNDSGATLFQALEDNITQLDGHTHDGVDSPALPAQSIVGVTQTISSASWVASGATGHYRQSVTLPAGFSYNTVTLSFRLTSGHVIYPTVEKISATQFYVYSSDNTIDFVLVAGG